MAKKSDRLFLGTVERRINATSLSALEASELDAVGLARAVAAGALQFADGNVALAESRVGLTAAGLIKNSPIAPA